MAVRKKQKSFLDEFLHVKRVDGISIKDRSKGFLYLHDVITKTMAEGKDFKIGNIDFSQFTEDDLSEYMSYYAGYLEPMENHCVFLMNRIGYDMSQYPVIKRFRGALR